MASRPGGLRQVHMNITINISDIIVENRLRKDYGDITALTRSIRDNGLIQPIVLIPTESGPKLLAGERRLIALRALQRTILSHRDPNGTGEFIWNHEQDEFQRVTMEVEENLQRKELSWQEMVVGKQRLLDLMQKKYGAPKLGHPTINMQDLSAAGFGVNKLAAMLGESPATTSKHLSVAQKLAQNPGLAKAPTVEAASRQIKIVEAFASMAMAAKAAPSKAKEWTLHEGDLRVNVASIPDASVDLVYTDLPFGVNLDAMSKHPTGISYSDTRQQVLSLLPEVLLQSYRILRSNRYSVYFFGFNYYQELIEYLRSAGFEFNPVPVVWYKHTRSTENPNTRYANAYDPAIVAWKGSPVFIRPGQTNVVDIPAVAAGTKLQIAQQPVELVQRFIGDMTAPGATVLDFCAGSGTTGEAALKMQRKVILFEREPGLCNIIKARLGAL